MQGGRAFIALFTCGKSVRFTSRIVGRDVEQNGVATVDVGCVEHIFTPEDVARFGL